MVIRNLTIMLLSSSIWTWTLAGTLCSQQKPHFYAFTPLLDRAVAKRRYITHKILKTTTWFFFSVVDNLIKFCYKKRIKAPVLIYLLYISWQKLVDFSQKWPFFMEKMRLDGSSASFFQQEWSYSVGYEKLMKFC